MAKVIARHLTMDMYKCNPDALVNSELPKEDIIDLFNKNGFDVISSELFDLNAGHKAFFMLFSEGHCSIHTFPILGYVAIDFFLCEPAASPEKFFTDLRNIFSPQKTKTTYLKRGDFGTVADMKPVIKTKSHRIRNTGVKVIRLLSHRPSLYEDK